MIDISVLDLDLDQRIVIPEEDSKELGIPQSILVSELMEAIEIEKEPKKKMVEIESDLNMEL
tara:strand:+ start:1592 stop:1777 length:186 start_codon:yes stop_codon:yes gene_type:complete